MMGNVFSDGVTGYVPRVESASVVDCTTGDDYTWLTYNLCCPGDDDQEEEVDDGVVVVVVWWWCGGGGVTVVAVARRC